MDGHYTSTVCATRGFYIACICPIFPQRDVILNRSLLYLSSCHLDVQTRTESSTKQVPRAVGRHVFTHQIITLVGLNVIICPPETWTGFDTYNEHHVFCPFSIISSFGSCSFLNSAVPYTLQHIAYLLHNLCIPTTALFTLALLASDAYNEASETPKLRLSTCVHTCNIQTGQFTTGHFNFGILYL
jgi:hypothetical protein